LRMKFIQIGSDGGFLNAPVTLSHLTLAPAERADVILDFSQLSGQTIILRNNAKAPFPSGEAADPRTVGQIMAFRVSKPLAGLNKLLQPQRQGQKTRYARHATERYLLQPQRQGQKTRHPRHAAERHRRGWRHPVSLPWRSAGPRAAGPRRWLDKA